MCTELKFAPNSWQISTFAANYKGRPYMTAMSQNKPLLTALGVGIVTCWACALEIFPELNQYMQVH